MDLDPAFTCIATHPDLGRCVMVKDHDCNHGNDSGLWREDGSAIELGE